MWRSFKTQDGKKYKPYFSHNADTKCKYGDDSDYKTEWHIRMQDYFPKEFQEWLFTDKKTGEKHIADVYLSNQNMVLEFQHSPIDGNEFWRRTHFHIGEGRRVIWLFDESNRGKKENAYGRFGKNDMMYVTNPFYADRTFKWLRNPRYYLADEYESVPEDMLSICVYTGTEGDVFHKLVGHDFEFGFEYVRFSLHDIEMDGNMDFEEFFAPEETWYTDEQWKFINDKEKMQQRLKEEKRKQEQALLDNFSKSYLKW